MIRLVSPQKGVVYYEGEPILCEAHARSGFADVSDKITWSLDGQLVGTGKNATIRPTIGPHQLVAQVYGTNQKSTVPVVVKKLPLSKNQLVPLLIEKFRPFIRGSISQWRERIGAILAAGIPSSWPELAERFRSLAARFGLNLPSSMAIPVIKSDHIRPTISVDPATRAAVEHLVGRMIANHENRVWAQRISAYDRAARGGDPVQYLVGLATAVSLFADDVIAARSALFTGSGGFNASILAGMAGVGILVAADTSASRASQLVNATPEIAGAFAVREGINSRFMKWSANLSLEERQRPSESVQKLFGMTSLFDATIIAAIESARRFFWTSANAASGFPVFVTHISVLDTRTTNICRPRHMARYRLVGGNFTPIYGSPDYWPPPRHFHCRASAVYSNQPIDGSWTLNSGISQLAGMQNTIFGVDITGMSGAEVAEIINSRPMSYLNAAKLLNKLV